MRTLPRGYHQGLGPGAELSANLADLRTEHGFEGGYDSVKRFARRLKTTTPLPFRRMECEPGQEAQIDFGTGAPIVKPDGKRRRTHVFRIVLSHSRKAYSEVVYRQTTDDFIRCIENAFHHFGGVPKTLVIDNLRAAVSKADWFDPELNPRIQAFCEHYGTVTCRPRQPFWTASCITRTSSRSLVRATGWKNRATKNEACKEEAK